MHTFETDSANIHFNPDFSGDIEISGKWYEEKQRITITSEDLFSFFDYYLRTEIQTKLEEMGTIELYKLYSQLKG